MRLLKLFLVAMLLSCCAKDNIFKDDELSLEKESYEGEQLRIDGYYYYRYSTSKGYRLLTYFLYNDGTLIYGGAPLESNQSEKEQQYASGEFYENEKNRKSNWGVFQIDGNLIKFERWYPSQPPLKAYVREGEILNDTTFKITQSYRMKDGEKTERKDRDETFNFKEFSPKPDSTNKFVD